MTNTVTPATPNQREAIGLALTRLILPPDATEAEAAHLFEKIEEIAAALRSAVMAMIRSDMIELTLGDRIYHAPRIIADHEVIDGDTMLFRAKKKATSDREDGKWFLAHQNEIPTALRGKVVFIFTEWRFFGCSKSVAVVLWNNIRWARYWGDGGWKSHCRPVTRSA